MKNKKLCFISLLFTLYLAPASASPLIVAHRAGTTDHPENTQHAISMALQNNADVIWITVQLSKDGVPVLYRPSDLKDRTDGYGLVSDYFWLDLQRLDAAYYFNINEQYIYRGKGVKIPSLRQVLTEFHNKKFIIDIKSPDADPKVMANALANIIIETGSKDNVTFYSTEKEYLAALPNHLTKFEPRNMTRKILANVIMANNCQVTTKKENSKLTENTYKYHAFELERNVKVVEKFTLGKGSSRAQLVWNQPAMKCFKKNNDTKVLLIGINSEQDYQFAKSLGADYVMVDSPVAAKYWR